MLNKLAHFPTLGTENLGLVNNEMEKFHNRVEINKLENWMLTWKKFPDFPTFQSNFLKFPDFPRPPPIKMLLFPRSVYTITRVTDTSPYKATDEDHCQISNTTKTDQFYVVCNG